MAYRLRADVYESQENYKAALADYTKYIEFDNSSINYYLYQERVRICKKLGDNEAALADYSTAIQIISETRGDEFEIGGDKFKELALANISYLRGSLHYKTGKYNKVVEDLSYTIDWYDKKDLAEMYYICGLAYKALGDKTRAKADFETAVKLDPDEAKYREELEKAG